LAAATGRTLVLPPKEPLYLLVRFINRVIPYLRIVVQIYKDNTMIILSPSFLLTHFYPFT
jgi:hypothetical protein